MLVVGGATRRPFRTACRACRAGLQWLHNVAKLVDDDSSVPSLLFWSLPLDSLQQLDSQTTMASASNAAGSLNNPRLFRSIMRRMNRNRDLCGLRPVLRWSTTDSNPGRPFVGKKWCGLFLWIDKILEKDVITCDGRTSPSIDNE
ncbi:hypothetical protein Ahy_A07g036351 isoform A [Arachis hypogaea]|uniref:Uncharacterized protein n=1 Tax=Arachis hypogaea TaxID=3818 RepID=A0A445CFY0_ARAHY|nr:hypothetical protein Ahy_A07g036351 isoform A [Arachis hypogaea]